MGFWANGFWAQGFWATGFWAEAAGEVEQRIAGAAPPRIRALTASPLGAHRLGDP